MVHWRKFDEKIQNARQNVLTDVTAIREWDNKFNIKRSLLEVYDGILYRNTSNFQGTGSRKSVFKKLTNSNELNSHNKRSCVVLKLHFPTPPTNSM